MTCLALCDGDCRTKRDITTIPEEAEDDEVNGEEGKEEDEADMTEEEEEEEAVTEDHSEDLGWWRCHDNVVH